MFIFEALKEIWNWHSLHLFGFCPNKILESVPNENLSQALHISTSSSDLDPFTRWHTEEFEKIKTLLISCFVCVCVWIDWAYGHAHGRPCTCIHKTMSDTRSPCHICYYYNTVAMSPQEDALFTRLNVTWLSPFFLVGQSFDDYMNRVSGILAQKMSAIQLLQDQIKDYQSRFSAHHTPQPAPSSSVSGSDYHGSCLANT